MLSKSTLKRVRQWLDSDLDPAGRREVQRLLDGGEEAELEDRFAFDMEFGTGGLRGVMAAGTNRMNTYTVARATQGLADYVRRQKIRRPSAVIAYDSRHHSREFAQTTAGVFAANGITVYLFRQLRPTPLLSFAVRHFGATVGVVITASHNPKEYNGYKVYWDDGAQVVPPHDKGIIGEVKGILSARQINRIDYPIAKANGLINLIGAEVDRAYLRAIQPLSLHPEVIERVANQLRIVYTPLHGTGTSIVPKALHSWGFEAVEVVSSQSRPDGDFPTVKYPNPEYLPAMDQAVAQARKTDAHLILATDPDCDRLGVGVRVRQGEYKMLTGNQTGALLADYVCREMKSLNRMPENPLIVTTIVSTGLIERIGESYGIEVEETLTGFKWICEKIRLNEERRSRGEPYHRFIYGTEESYGYLAGTEVRDKDGVIAACLCAELAADEFAKGKNLFDLLDEIEMRCGAFLETQKSIHHKGIEGLSKIKRIMESLRSEPPKEIGGIAVEAMGDVKQGCWFPIANLAAPPQHLAIADLPESDVLIFQLADGSKVIARPSGTEPKIKFYFNLCERDCSPFTSLSQLERARQELMSKMRLLQNHFLLQLEAL